MTRKVLRFLGSRYGIGIILLVVVIVIVSIARANSGSNPSTTTNESDSGIGTEDAGEPNDGVLDESESGKPQLPQKAIDVATDFAEAYIDAEQSAEKWRKAWGENATERVKEQLQGVDPKAVGIKEIQDEPTVEGQSVNFPTDAGLLMLRVKEQDGVWLVDGIDFKKS